MKKSNLFQVLLFAVLLTFSFISFPSCSTSTSVGDVVCDYGTVLCDVSTSLCTDIPGIPPVVCNYLDLACYNLNTLCQLRDSTESPKYQAAIENIQDLTIKLKQWKLAHANKK